MSNITRLTPIIPILIAAVFLTSCEALEVADFNPETRPIPTIARAPTIETAPTTEQFEGFEQAPTATQFEGFEQAPTVTQFEGFQQAPTATQFEGFEQAPTVTQFEGFNDEEDSNPCIIYLDNPTPQNAEAAAEWAINYLEAAGNQVDRNSPEHITAACQAVLTNHP